MIVGARTRKRKRRAFTLSELLAVITIVASLIGLLLPTLVGVRKSAWQSVCASNLFQIGTATSMYLADYDDRYPILINALEREDTSIRFGRDITDDPSAYPTPKEVLEPYTKEDRIFICPLDIGAAIGRTFRAYPRLYSRNGGSSYLFAELFQGQTPQSWADPTKVIWACDGSPSWHSRNFTEIDSATYRIMAVFYDFHVALVSNRNAPNFLE